MAGIPIITGFDLSAASPIDSRLVMPDQVAREAIFWKYPGLIVYQVDDDTFYRWDGVIWTTFGGGGAPGTPGAPGSIWYNGSGAPPSLLGIDGDYYLDNATGDVYQKQAGSWVMLLNIRGPAGAAGAGGAYGSIIAREGVAVQVIDATDQKVTQFTADGPFLTINPEHTNDRILVPDAGAYVLYFEADITSTVNKKFILTVYVNGVATPVTSTFDTASNNTPNISFQYAVPIAAGSTVELYIRQTSGSTANFTIVTGALGIFSIEAKGDTGLAGEALIHTQSDIILDEAKIASVQAGVWTPQSPYSASILADNRANLSSPPNISGNKVGHSISYRGSGLWSDNGIWRGPSGAPGSSGTPGANGALVTGGTKIRQGPYTYNSEVLGTLGAILAHSAFYGKTYLGVAFTTPAEAGWKVKLEFTVQCRGHNNPATVRFIPQRSSDGGTTWATVPGAPVPIFDFVTGASYHTTVYVNFVDAFTAANTGYMYRLVGYNSNSSQDNYFSTGFGYCLTLIPT